MKILKNNGITLIALIITIIVLLILAVVAINSVNGDGIISKAKNARTNYQTAQDIESLTLAKYLTDIENANNNSNNGSISGETIVLEEGLPIPSGWFYIILTDELEYGWKADCYAASETEIANNTMTFDSSTLVLNYKGLTMPDEDTFKENGYLLCKNNGLIFGSSLDDNEENIDGLNLDVDNSIKNTLTSVSLINDVINGGITIYGHNKVKEVKLRECTALVDASALNMSGFTDISHMFGRCTSLTKAPIIPTSITKIADCFSGCTSLTEITYAGTVEQFKQIDGYERCGDTGLVVHCTNGDYTVGIIR